MRNQNDLLLGVVGLAGGAMLIRQMLAPRYSFRGKVVVITGGARGLGLVMARQLAREGARLVIVSRTAEQLRRAHDELQSLGAEVMAFTCDVTDRIDCISLIDQTLHAWGHIDVLINNAGMIRVGPVETMEVDDYREAMDVHF